MIIIGYVIFKYFNNTYVIMDLRRKVTILFIFKCLVVFTLSVLVVFRYEPLFGVILFVLYLFIETKYEIDFARAVVKYSVDEITEKVKEQLDYVTSFVSSCLYDTLKKEKLSTKKIRKIVYSFRDMVLSRLDELKEGV